MGVTGVLGTEGSHYEVRIDAFYDEIKNEGDVILRSGSRAALINFTLGWMFSFENDELIYCEPTGDDKRALSFDEFKLTVDQTANGEHVITGSMGVIILDTVQFDVVRPHKFDNPTPYDCAHVRKE